MKFRWKRALFAVLAMALWATIFWYCRDTFSETIQQFNPEEPSLVGLSWTSLVLFWAFRLFAVFPTLVFAGLGMKMLQATTDGLLMYKAGPLLSTSSRRTRKYNSEEERFNRFCIRTVFFVVLVSTLIPSAWIGSPYLGAILLMPIACGLLSIEWIGAEAIGQVYKKRHGFRQDRVIHAKAAIPETMFLLMLTFIMLALFLGCHLPYYGAAVWAGVIPFEEGRHQLLRLHAFILWLFFPLYFFKVRSQTVLLNFLKLNLWFLPWGRILARAHRIGGGLTGGAGATRSV